MQLLKKKNGDFKACNRDFWLIFAKKKKLKFKMAYFCCQAPQVVWTVICNTVFQYQFSKIKKGPKML